MHRVLFLLLLLVISAPRSGISEETSPVTIEPRTIIEQSPTAQEQAQKPPLQRRTLGGFEGEFALGDRPVIVLVGGSDVVKQSENGYLELLLTRYAESTPIHVRNLAWQADTVYRQQRPRNFGTHLEMLHRVDASIVLSSFGQMEALEGPGKLPEFIEAYRKLLEEYAAKTRRIVLITPHPFDAPQSELLPDLTKHNSSIQLYADAIEDLAMELGFLSVNLSSWDTTGLTRDGIHLTDEGHWKLAFETVTQLTGASPVSGESLQPDGTLSEPAHEALRNAIQTKNFLWHQHWRPTNWAFAYGDRQKVPSSHDHRPDKPRWMPQEIANIIKLIHSAEEDIQTKNTQIK